MEKENKKCPTFCDEMPKRRISGRFKGQLQKKRERKFKPHQLIDNPKVLLNGQEQNKNQLLLSENIDEKILVEILEMIFRKGDGRLAKASRHL